jgi:hypothetical protein
VYAEVKKPSFLGEIERGLSSFKKSETGNWLNTIEI